MDSYRLFVGVVFAISVFLLVDAWIRDRAPAPAARPAPAAEQSAPPTPSPGLSPPSPTPAPVAAPAPGAIAPAQSAALPRGERIEVRTDTLLVEIDTHGGDLRRVELLQHRDRADPSKNFVLLDDSGPRVYVAQSGLAAEELPNHNTVFAAERRNYALEAGQDQVVVPLTAATASGVRVAKTYVFARDSYAVKVSLQTSNGTRDPVNSAAYFQLLRDADPPEGGSKMMPVFSGVEIYTQQDKLFKIDFSDIVEGKAEHPKQASDGWIAFVQHYFVAALIPQEGATREFFARSLGNNLIAGGVFVPVGTIAPNEAREVSATLYVGPQEQDRLKALAPGLDLTVDYGMFRVLAVPLFWVLEAIHDVVGNWGVAIIILTVIIKILFYPLSAASYRSMAKMKVLAPKLQRLKERYGDDRQKMHQAMIELYKTEKINPLGGCLPIVVQIPVFIALYWVLLLSVELRHAPFMLWINDLSAPDPYYILPVLMGATMFIQTWLNPTPPDPVQARLMKIMPIAFSVFFFFFPSGLVLYWLVNNVLSILQQWYITRQLERSKAAHAEG
jgi:YidC/Oxa1 family membrane protein insertase